MDYITAQEAAKKWNISVRRAQLLCAEGRIAGAIKHASVWFIPQNAEKPADGRAGRKSPRKKWYLGSIYFAEIEACMVKLTARTCF